MTRKLVTLDVCQDIREGRQPCSRIMQTVSALQESEDLQLIAPFEPVPLFGLLGEQGFGHAAKPIGSGDWEVLFSKDIPVEAPSPGPVGPAACQSPCGCTDVVEVDARGLEPPQPMVKILEALAQLPAGAELHARTDRRPIHLFPQLASRGFAATTEELSDGSFVNRIHRA